MKVRAQVLVGPGEFQLGELDLEAPGPGELRLRVEACGICGSDKMLQYVCAPGTVLGHEIVAEVESWGPGVSGWRRGDRAVPLGDGIGMGDTGRLGGFCEGLVVAAAACVRVPEEVPHRTAVLAEPLGNGLHFVRRSRLRRGQRVAILGGGQIGLSVLFWARRLGAGRIAVSEPAAARAEFARALGADAVFSPAGVDDLSAAMAGALGGAPDVVFEAVGRPEVMADAIHMVGGPGGIVVLAGITLDTLGIQPVALALKETDLVFPIGTTGAEVEEVLTVLANGEFPADRFISHRVGLAAMPEAVRALGHPTDQIKVVVDHGAGGGAVGR